MNKKVSVSTCVMCPKLTTVGNFYICECTNKDISGAAIYRDIPEWCPLMNNSVVKFLNSH